MKKKNIENFAIYKEMEKMFFENEIISQNHGGTKIEMVDVPTNQIENGIKLIEPTY